MANQHKPLVFFSADGSTEEIFKSHLEGKKKKKKEQPKK